jgi:hypothetical protein
VAEELRSHIAYEPSLEMYLGIKKSVVGTVFSTSLLRFISFISFLLFHFF